MSFRAPLVGQYRKVNVSFLEERSQRVEIDPRYVFYEAILKSENFEQYYEKVGHIIVYPETTNFAVNADMEIKYVLRRGWIVTR